MEAVQWPQEIVMKPMEEINVTTRTCSSKTNSLDLGRRPAITWPQTRTQTQTQTQTQIQTERQQQQQHSRLNCPRCHSTNTKFCYYNNYSLTQPRYYCKTCKRYWTEGGTLRNIPVGGGSRKNKKSPSSSSSSKKLPRHDLVLPTATTDGNCNLHAPQNPNIINLQGKDLNLSFPVVNDFKTISELIRVPNFDSNDDKNKMPSSCSSSPSHLSSLELLNGIASGGFNSFLTMPTADVYSHGFSLPELKPSLNFSLDGLGSSGFASLQREHENGGRTLFPFEDLKQFTSTTTNKDQHSDSKGYWNGMLAGGSW